MGSKIVFYTVDSYNDVSGTKGQDILDGNSDCMAGRELYLLQPFLIYKLHYKKIRCQIKLKGWIISYETGDTDHKYSDGNTTGSISFLHWLCRQIENCVAGNAFSYRECRLEGSLLAIRIISLRVVFRQ
jgi:hypothetical protein